ncbi:MAG: hypothetical protein ABIK81_01760 [candidate division WOR-3 bacterium]
MDQEKGGEREEETGRGNRREKREGREEKIRGERAEGIRESIGGIIITFYPPGMP